MIFSFDPGRVKLGWAILQKENQEIVKFGESNINARINKYMFAKFMILVDEEFREFLPECTMVIIESQPGRLNSKSKYVEHMISNVFSTLQYENDGCNLDVTIVSAGSKFKGYNMSELHGKVNYTRRKKKAVEIVNEIYNIEVKSYDIADAILQANRFIKYR